MSQPATTSASSASLNNLVNFPPFSLGYFQVIEQLCANDAFNSSAVEQMAGNIINHSSPFDANIMHFQIIARHLTECVLNQVGIKKFFINNTSQQLFDAFMQEPHDAKTEILYFKYARIVFLIGTNRFYQEFQQRYNKPPQQVFIPQPPPQQVGIQQSPIPQTSSSGPNLIPSRPDQQAPKRPVQPVPRPPQKQGPFLQSTLYPSGYNGPLIATETNPVEDYSLPRSQPSNSNPNTSSSTVNVSETPKYVNNFNSQTTSFSESSQSRAGQRASTVSSQSVQPRINQRPSTVSSQRGTRFGAPSPKPGEMSDVVKTLLQQREQQQREQQQQQQSTNPGTGTSRQGQQTVEQQDTESSSEIEYIDAPQEFCDYVCEILADERNGVDRFTFFLNNDQYVKKNQNKITSYLTYLILDYAVEDMKEAFINCMSFFVNVPVFKKVCMIRNQPKYATFFD